MISSGFIALTQVAMQEQARVLDAAAQAGVTINTLDDRALYTSMLEMRQNIETPKEEQVRKESLVYTERHLENWLLEREARIFTTATIWKAA